MVTIELPHDICCTADECYCSRQTHGALEYGGPGGSKRVRGGRKRIPKSITLLAKGDPGGGDKAYGLPPSVVRAPSYLGQASSLKLTELTASDTKKQTDDLAKAEKAREKEATERKKFLAAKAKTQLDAEIAAAMSDEEKAAKLEADKKAAEEKVAADKAAAAEQKAAQEKADAEAKAAEEKKAAAASKRGGK